MGRKIHNLTLHAPPEGLTVREILLRVRPAHLDYALDVRTRPTKGPSLDTVVKPGLTYIHAVTMLLAGEVLEWHIRLIPFPPEPGDDEPDLVDATFHWKPEPA